jgi:hypothetical protein
MATIAPPPAEWPTEAELCPPAVWRLAPHPNTDATPTLVPPPGDDR